MRFDPERVTAHAGVTVDSAPDFADSVSRAADGFVERMRVEGWKVEREPARSTSAPLVPIAVLMVGWFLAEFHRVAPSASPLVRVAVAGWYLASLALWLFLAVRRATGAPVVEALSSHILATDANAGSRPARLVVLARLPSRASGWSTRGWALLLVLLIVPGLAIILGGTKGHPWMGSGVLVGQWLAICLAIGTIIPPRRAFDASGVAMLTELARTWPRGARDRVETWFVATPDVRDLDRRFNDEKPTLAVAIDSPGRGPELVIAGRGAAADLTATAAAALWVPYRRTNAVPSGVGHAGFRAGAVPCVTLFGTDDGRPIDPAKLARVAQLVNEIAFRWGKLAAAADQTPGASRARSSQNPG